MFEVIGLIIVLIFGAWLTFSGAAIHVFGSLLKSKSESIGGLIIFIVGVSIICTTLYFNVALK